MNRTGFVNSVQRKVRIRNDFATTFIIGVFLGGAGCSAVIQVRTGPGCWSSRHSSSSSKRWTSRSETKPGEQACSLVTNQVLHSGEVMTHNESDTDRVGQFKIIFVMTAVELLH